MRKSILVALVPILCFACTTKKASTDEFRSIDKEQDYKLQMADTSMFGDSVYSQVRVKMLWPEALAGQNADSLQREMIRAAFNDSVSTTADAAVKRYLETPVTYMEGDKAVAVDTVPPAGMNVRVLSKYLTVDTVYTDSSVLSFSIVAEGYEGGAHGSYSATYLNYDRKAGKMLNVKDVVADTTAVRDLIVKQLAADKGVKTPQELVDNGVVFSVDGIYMALQFYFTPNEVAFFYNPYEIGPWASGPITVKVPRKSLTPYLTEEGKQLF